MGERSRSIKFKELFRLGFAYWFAAASNIAFMVAVMNFVNIAQVFFMKKYHLTATQANSANSIVYFTSGIISSLSNAFKLLSTFYTFIFRLLFFSMYGPVCIWLLGLDLGEF